jgi:hypothetical protein
MMPEEKTDAPVNTDKDKVDNPPVTDKKEPEKITPEPVKDKDNVDSAKNYDELRKTYTQTAMEKAELARKNEELERRLAEKEAPPVKETPKQASLQDRLAKLEKLKELCPAQGVDDTIYDEQIDNLKFRIGQEANQRIFQEKMNDFNSFTADDEVKQELDKGLYTIDDLSKIQESAHKKGYNYDLMAARNSFLSENKKKVSDWQAKLRGEAINASTDTGETKKASVGKTEQDKVRSGLGLY